MANPISLAQGWQLFDEIMSGRRKERREANRALQAFVLQGMINEASRQRLMLKEAQLRSDAGVRQAQTQGLMKLLQDRQATQHEIESEERQHGYDLELESVKAGYEKELEGYKAGLKPEGMPADWWKKDIDVQMRLDRVKQIDQMIYDPMFQASDEKTKQGVLDERKRLAGEIQDIAVQRGQPMYISPTPNVSMLQSEAAQQAVIGRMGELYGKGWSDDQVRNELFADFSDILTGLSPDQIGNMVENYIVTWKSQQERVTVGDLFKVPSEARVGPFQVTGAIGDIAKKIPELYFSLPYYKSQK